MKDQTYLGDIILYDGLALELQKAITKLLWWIKKQRAKISIFKISACNSQGKNDVQLSLLIYFTYVGNKIMTLQGQTWAKTFKMWN